VLVLLSQVLCCHFVHHCAYLLLLLFFVDLGSAGVVAAVC